jgi:hypothetical protein
METERKSTHFSPKSQLIILSLLLGCAIALFSNYHKNELKKAVAQAIDNNTSDYPYALNDIEKVLDKQLIGWNNGNIDQFMDGYVKDSSVRFITDNKVKTSWQEITDSYKKGYPDKEAMGKLTFHRDEIRWVNQSASIAQVIGRWEVIQKHREKLASGSISLDNTTPRNSDNSNHQPTYDTLSGRFSLIFVGTEKGPKIQIDHTW